MNFQVTSHLGGRSLVFVIRSLAHDYVVVTARNHTPSGRGGSTISCEVVSRDPHESDCAPTDSIALTAFDITGNSTALPLDRREECSSYFFAVKIVLLFMSVSITARRLYGLRSISCPYSGTGGKELSYFVESLDMMGGLVQVR